MAISAKLATSMGAMTLARGIGFRGKRNTSARLTSAIPSTSRCSTCQLPSPIRGGATTRASGLPSDRKVSASGSPSRIFSAGASPSSM